MQKDPLSRVLAAGIPLLLLGAMWVPNFIAGDTSTREDPAQLLEDAALGLVFWLLSCALVGRLSRMLWLSLPIALIWPLEIWVRVHYGVPISPHVVALVRETTWAEGENFFSAYGIGLALFLVVWLLLYVIGLWWVNRRDLHWTHRSRWWCLGALLMLLAALQYLHGGKDLAANELSRDKLNVSAPSDWALQWGTVFPVNVVVSFQKDQQQRRLLQTMQAAMSARSMGAWQVTTENAPKIVVLVIGESASATHWGLLGYARDTTPLLAKVEGLVAFSDVVSLSTATRTAVPGVISRRPVLSPDGHLDEEAEPSLVKAFAEVGYQTHWLSNQSPLGPYDTSISVYAREAKDIRFLNPSTYEQLSSYDEVLLPPLRSILAQPGRHLIVLHLLGSHFNYALRYPDAYDRFTPSLKTPGAVLSESAQFQKRTDNSYDNSVLYTDYVLSTILTTVEERGDASVVAYFSDHGTDSALGPCPGRSGSRRSEASFRVPAFVWLSRSMRMGTDSRWTQLRANANEPYRTRALFATMLELSNIDIAGEVPDESFLRKPDLSASARYVADANSTLVDFDGARRKNACSIAAR